MDTVIKKCMSAIEDSSQLLLQHLEGEDRNTFATEITSVMANLCKADMVSKAQTEALSVLEESEIDVACYDKAFLSELNKLQSNIKKENHPVYKQFCNTQKNLLKLDNNNANVDDDIVAGDTEEVLIDPLTKKPLSIAVRSTKCGHLYEKSTVAEYVKLRKHKAKCPVVGCKYKGPILISDLKIDQDVIQRITQRSNNQ